MENYLVKKYSKILSESILTDEICKVLIQVPKDERTGHRACHIEIVHLTLKNGENLELFTKNRVRRCCQELDCQMTAVMITEGKFLKEFTDDMKHFCRQNSQDGSDNLISDLIPHAYYYDPNIVVLESLSKRGFKNFDTKYRHNFHQAKLVLTSLARFHAISHLVIQKEGGEKLFLEKHQHFKNPLLKPKLMQFFYPAFENNFEKSLEIVQNSGNAEGNSTCDFLGKFKGNLEKVIVEAITAKHVVVSICHANLCANNIMFSGSQEGQSSDDKVIFVDFQTCRTGSPNADIGYYLFRSVGIDTRKRWKELLHIYFEKFDQTMRALGQPFEMKFEDFFEDFVCKSTLGFLFGVVLASGCVTKKTDVEISQEIIEMVKDYKSIEMYATTIQDQN